GTDRWRGSTLPPAAWSPCHQPGRSSPRARHGRRSRAPLAGTVRGVRWVVPGAVTARRTARHRHVAAAATLLAPVRSGCRAAARQPAHDDPARCPDMTLMALLRIRPPVRSPGLRHQYTRTYYREPAPPSRACRPEFLAATSDQALLATI